MQKILTHVHVAVLYLFAILFVVPGGALAREAKPAITRGSFTGQAAGKGYDLPNQYMVTPTKLLAENMEPVVPHPKQEKLAREKLAALEKKFGKKPNILIFLMDDVGWMDPGFMGGGTAVGNATPIMDRLANSGMVLTSAYATPACTPTRATIHTGQNPLHHGLLRPAMYGEPGGLEGAITFPMLLQQLGYVTQGVGKWHMGENAGSLPNSLGYDDFYGFLSVSDMYTEWRDIYFNPEVALRPARFKALKHGKFNHNNVHLVKGNKKVEDVYELNLTTIRDLDQDWAGYSVNFIHKMKDSKQPWFLYHATRGCHFDNYPNDKFLGKSQAGTCYSDCIVEMDDVLGQIMDALEKSGQLENTLIFFTSDNGPECEVEPHGRSPFRGCKGSSWEGGVRVPTFVYWKDMIQPSRTDGLFDLADLFNTALSLAGKPGAQAASLVPKDRYIDGIDQTSFLLGDAGLSNRRSRIYTMNQYFSALRIDEFKHHYAIALQQAIFANGNKGGFSGSNEADLGSGVMSNLYTNPQEDMGIGIRHLPMTMQISAEYKRYKEVLKKFPPKTVIGVAGQNK
jgi:arylsulfatase A-like enzyme